MPGIVVGFSGGPDSVFLVEWLLLQNTQNIVLAHFNHCLRGKSSDEDEQFCIEYAAQKNIPFFSERWGNPISSEEKARNARYDFLERIRKQENAQNVAIAHHQDDNVETILLQFLRGGSISSRSGLCDTDKNRNLIRPILHFSKKEILDFLEKNNIQFCIDESNFEVDLYTRNFIRHELLPTIKKKFSSFEKNLLKESLRMTELEFFIEKQAENFLEKFSIEKGIVIDDFLMLPSALQREILKKILNNPYSELHFFSSFIKFLSQSASGKHFEIKNFVFSVYGKFFFVEPS